MNMPFVGNFQGMDRDSEGFQSLATSALDLLGIYSK